MISGSRTVQGRITGQVISCPPAPSRDGLTTVLLAPGGRVFMGVQIVSLATFPVCPESSNEVIIDNDSRTPKHI